MSKPFFYIDQNILSKEAKGEINYSKVDKVTWTFSDEHFKEIARDKKFGPQFYLDTLVKLNAQLIYLNQSHEVIKVENVGIKQAYQEYLQNNSSSQFNSSVFNPLVAKFKGAKNSKSAEEISSNIKDSILEMFDNLGNENFSPDLIKQVKEMPSYTQEIDSMPGIEKLREDLLGKGKGKFSKFKSDQPLNDMYDMIKDIIYKMKFDMIYDMMYDIR